MSGGSAGIARIVGIETPKGVPADAQPIGSRHLVVEMHSPLLLGVGAGVIEVKCGIWTRVGKRLRLPLVLVVCEIVQPVLDDRATPRYAELLVRIGKHPLLHEVLGDELVRADVGSVGSERRIRAR